MNAFDSWLGYNLKDKNPNDLKTTQFNAKIAEQNAASTGKQKNFDHFAPSTSRSDPKLRKPKESVNELKESKDTLETMQEMMRQLTVLTKSVASFHDPERHRNPSGPKPYWNNIIEGQKEIIIEDDLNIQKVLKGRM